jgi:hypothetical protein
VAARLAAVLVAVVAGAASFEHIASVAIGAGERTWVGYSLPLAIDGLIVVGVAALLEDQRHHRHGRGSARLAVLVGVVATLAANVASAEPTWTARLVALAAPVSFLLSVEVLTRTGRPLTTPDATTTTPPAAKPPTTTVPGDRPAPATVARRRPTAALRVARAVAASPEATPAEIAARLKVSERTVQRYWPPANPGQTNPAPANHTSAESTPATPAPAATTGPAPLNGGTWNGRSRGVAPVPAAAFHRPEPAPAVVPDPGVAR